MAQLRVQMEIISQLEAQVSTPSSPSSHYPPDRHQTAPRLYASVGFNGLLDNGFCLVTH